ncbi:MAG: VOC family protein [Actinobacteria bacterium]|nr:VOC family protein [Actinomycetota bacterium]
MTLRLAHTAICVPDVDAATAWYADVLGLRVLSPPYLMDGRSIAEDMGELLPPPPAVKAAILGNDDTDHVLELVEYPNAPPVTEADSRRFTDVGISHVGLFCDDITATRQALEDNGVTFLTTGVADIAGLRTAWFTDPWGTVFILVQKRKRPDHPYWQQY